MALTAYIDESGTHGDESPATIMACFIARPEQWASYERQLGHLLSDYGVSVFHAKQFRRSKGEFKHWDNRKKERFNAQFLKLIDDNISCGFCSVLSTKDYEDVYCAGGFPRKARHDTQYGLCFRVCMWQAILYLREHRDSWPLTVILESGHANAQDAIRVYRDVEQRLYPQFLGMLGKIDFASKEKRPLAAADSLAYSMFRKVAGSTNHQIQNVVSAGPTDPPYIVSNVPMRVTAITPETLALLRESLNHGFRRRS